MKRNWIEQPPKNDYERLHFLMSLHEEQQKEIEALKVAVKLLQAKRQPEQKEQKEIEKK